VDNKSSTSYKKKKKDLGARTQVGGPHAWVSFLKSGHAEPLSLAPLASFLFYFFITSFNFFFRKNTLFLLSYI
jgi:hypothetical protein